MNVATEETSVVNPMTSTEEKSRYGTVLHIASGKEQKGYLFLKRTFDIFFSAVALIVLFVPLMLLALIVFLDDPHASPFYSQDRVGRGGKIFKFWKLRSMVIDADRILLTLQNQNEKDGPVFKIKDDPRITRVGRFIRKTSLDELPQLWNVLKGDMSLVGPRPPLPSEVEKYNAYQRQRLTVTPGLTCYWQVQKNRDSIGFDDWVELDLKYITDRSLLVDLKLIFQTIHVVCTGQGQ